MGYLQYKKLLKEANKNSNENILENENINNILKKKCRMFGIYGGGISILSKERKSPLLLYAPEIQKKFGIEKNITKYEFINTSYNSINWEIPNANYFIDILFFLDRKQNIVPEYVNILHNENKNIFEYDFQYELRKNYEIIHCSIGEILFFSLAWLSLIKLISFNDLKTNLSSLTYTGDITYENIKSKFTDEKLSLEYSLLNFYFDFKKNEDEIYMAINESLKFFIEKILNQYFIYIIQKKEFRNYINNVLKVSELEETFNLEKLIQILIKVFELNTDNSTIYDLLNKIHNNARFPIIPYVFLIFLDKSKSYKEHIVFPIWNTYSKYTAYNVDNNINEYSVLHALYTIKPFWELNSKIENSEKYFCKKKINSSFKLQLTNIIKLINSLSKPIIDKEYYGKQLKKDFFNLKKQAIKSAIAKVFLRNMSHNIGSHVLTRLIKPNLIESNVLIKENQYESSFSEAEVKETAKDDFVKFQEDLKNNNIKIPNEIVITNKKEYDYYLELVSYFNSYLKSRMDFLADLVTGIPQIQNIKYFKSDIIKNFDRNRILLNRISGLDIKEEDDRNKFKFTIDVKLADNKEDVLVAISNDILGQHALYIILENIIRNTAKHGSSSIDGKITFTINVENSILDNSLYKIQIHDSLIRSDISTLVGDLNEKINSSILKDYFSLREGSLGLIEMLVSASYLRKIPIEDVNNEEYKIVFVENEINKAKERIKKKEKQHKILRAINKNNCLGYELYIPKPKELLIIDETNDIFCKLDENIRKNLESNGILLLNNNHSYKSNYKYDEKINYDHSALLVISNDNNLNKYESNLNLPYRKISFEELKKNYNSFHGIELKTNEFINKLNNNNDISDVIVEVWRALTYSKFLEKNLIPTNKELYKNYLIKPDNNDIFIDTFGIDQGQENNSEYTIQFPDHGKAYGYNLSQYSEVCPSEFKNIVTIIQKYENLKNSEILTKFKFLYSSITNIIVLDERIQEQVNTLRYSGYNQEKLLYRDLWDNVNVYIPIKDEIDLNAQSFKNDYLKQIINIIKNKFYNCERACKDLDIVLIHLGVIEKILKAENKNQNSLEIKNFIDAFNNSINSIKGDSKVKFVITSGRGQPDNIPEDIPFLNYSIVSQYLIEQRFKLFLSEVLYIAKRRSS